MKITEVRIKLMADPNDRLQAFCSITFDYAFVIRDLKIIQGTKGSFVAMPSRKLTDRCPGCHAKNHLRAAYCSECGASLDPERALHESDGRAKLFADIAHPINSECREMIQQRVLQAFEEELVNSRKPGYVCTYDDYGEENYASLREPLDILPMRSGRDNDDAAAVKRIDEAGAPTKAPHEKRAGESRESAGGESFGAGVM
jgi:stage V sporulation protein G